MLDLIPTGFLGLIFWGGVIMMLYGFYLGGRAFRIWWKYLRK